MIFTRSQIVGATALVLIAVAVIALYPVLMPAPNAMPNLRDPERIAAGSVVYNAHCASCHGAKLEGQPNWTSKLPTGRMPAPPHDDSGHTWHHPNDVLFAVTKSGLKPPHAPEGYTSDMPAFGGTLSDDEIWNVLAFIQSRWSERIRERQAQMDQHYNKSGSR